MTVALPQGLPAAGGWQLVDWIDRDWKSTAAIGATVTIETPQLPDTEMWLIDRLVVSSTSTSDTAARVYNSGTDRLRSGSRAGNFDEADYPGGLLLRPSSWLTVQWSGCSLGAVAALAVQARRFVRA
jgi:hypothetical protein